MVFSIDELDDPSGDRAPVFCLTTTTTTTTTTPHRCIEDLLCRAWLVPALPITPTSTCRFSDQGRRINVVLTVKAAAETQGNRAADFMIKHFDQHLPILYVH